MASTVWRLYPVISKHWCYIIRSSGKINSLTPANASWLLFQDCNKRHASAQALMEQTNISIDKASGILGTHKLLRKISDETLIESCNMLKVMGFSNEEIMETPECLGITANSMISYSRCLLDLGIKSVNPLELVNFKRVINMRITLLRAHGYIDQDTDIVSHALSQVHDLPANAAEKIKEEIGTIDESTKTLFDVHMMLQQKYLCWRLDIDVDRAAKITNTYYRIKYRSLSMIAEVIDIFLTEFGYTTEKIVRNGCLLHAHPSVIHETMEKLPQIAGIPLKRIIFKNPRLILTSTQHMIDVLELLKQFGFSDDAVYKCIRILTLSKQTIRERIVKALGDPYFNCLKWHPRFLYIILYNRMVANRLKLLQEMNMKCFSLQILSASSIPAFVRFTNGREDRTNGDDTLLYIAQMLDCNPTTLRVSMSRHPNWYYIPLNTVSSTLKLLAQRGFYPVHIRKNVHLLLYPTEQVTEILDSLTYNAPPDAVDWSDKFDCEMYVTNAEHNLPIVINPTKNFGSHMKYVEGSDKCVNIDLSKDVIDTAVTDWPDVLPTCLYLLEKPHHFSGDGVWVPHKDDKETVSSTQ